MPPSADTYRHSLIIAGVFFFPGATRVADADRPGSAARAGTLTYIHTYVSKSMSTTTVDRAIAIVSPTTLAWQPSGPI